MHSRTVLIFRCSSTHIASASSLPRSTLHWLLPGHINQHSSSSATSVASKLWVAWNSNFPIHYNLLSHVSLTPRITDRLASDSRALTSSITGTKLRTCRWQRMGVHVHSVSGESFTSALASASLRSDAVSSVSFDKVVLRNGNSYLVQVGHTHSVLSLES